MCTRYLFVMEKINHFSIILRILTGVSIQSNEFIILKTKDLFRENSGTKKSGRTKKIIAQQQRLSERERKKKKSKLMVCSNKAVKQEYAVEVLNGILEIRGKSVIRFGLKKKKIFHYRGRCNAALD